VFRQNELLGSWQFSSWQLAILFQWQFSFSRSSSYFNMRSRYDVEILRTPASLQAVSRLITTESRLHRLMAMKEPSPKRKRTLALHERALTFSVNVNACCPQYFSNIPSETVWGQLVRAADSASNNLVEADDAISDADFLNKMGISLREAKESRTELMKLRLGNLDNYSNTAKLGLESEATQLCAIFSTIIRNTRSRIERENAARKNKRRSNNPETGTGT
jgi:four helix bundle protein